MYHASAEVNNAYLREPACVSFLPRAVRGLLETQTQDAQHDANSDPAFAFEERRAIPIVRCGERDERGRVAQGEADVRVQVRRGEPGWAGEELGVGTARRKAR